MKPTSRSRRLPSLVLFLVACAGIAATPLFGLGWQGDAPAGVPPEYREAAVRGDWAQAAATARELALKSPARADLALLLEARALRRDRQADVALVRLATLLEQHPSSVWHPSAASLRAEVLGELGRLAEAQDAWEARAEALRAPERKGALALQLVERAEVLARPPDPATPGAPAPRYADALVLLEHALVLEPPRAIQDRASYASALVHRASSGPPRTIEALEVYLEQFDPQRAGAGSAAGRHVFDARLMLGQLLLELQQHSRARRHFEDLLHDAQQARQGTGAFADASLPAEALAELETIEGEAAFAIAATFGEAEPLLAIGALRRFREAFPRHARTYEAAALIATSFEHAGRVDEALAAHTALATSPAPPRGDDVRREVHAKLAREAQFARGRLLAAQRRFAEAREAFERYAALYPSGERWSEAQQRIPDAQIGLGQELRREQRFDEARRAMQRFLDDQPLDRRAAQIAFEVGETFVEEATVLEERAVAVEEGEAEALLRSALAAWRTLPSRYPGTDEASRALLRIGEVLETRLRDLPAAIEAYRSVTFGASQAQARRRLEALLEPALAVRTERTFRSDEAARITLQTRNVERVRIDLFALDLESYFAKHHTHWRIERLDLDLIAPDRSFEVDLEGYRAYAPLERELDLGLEGVGAWAVAVTGGELRATTLVLRSDLELVLKSSRREAFVYVQDMANGTPAKDVQVLVADGDANMATLLTDRVGVARRSFEPLRQGGPLAALAVRKGHFAAAGLDLGGTALGVELVPRAYLYTDRPVYRPGDAVRWRALLRDVNENAFTFTRGAQHSVEVLDPGGVALFQGEHALSEFGTLHGEFTLPESAQWGSHTLRVVQRDGRSFTATFLVEPYQLQRVELLLELARDVVYRGEDVAVTAHVRHMHGEPISGAKLDIRLPGGRELVVATDLEGRATFDVETRDLGEEGLVDVSAVYLAEGLRAQASFYLAQRGFDLVLELERDVVLATEPFTVSARAVRPDGEPHETGLVLTVLRRSSLPNGEWSEVMLEERALRTDTSGSARTTLAVERGGEYTLRIAGVDRFQNPVQAATTIRVAGEGDDQRLRWIVADARVPVGAKVEPVLADRDGGGIALVTFEAERVLAHRIVDLRKGPNRVPFDVVEQHAPNVVVAAAALEGGRLHTASVEFEVRRELRVELELTNQRHVPGEMTRVRVRAVDGLGRPVRAELSLSAVDAALLARYPHDLPPVAAHFGAAGRRAAGLLTRSSIEFRYEGVTRRIASEVLAEAARVEERARREVLREELLEQLDRVALQDAAPPGAENEVAVEEGMDGDDWFLGIGGGAAGKHSGRQGGRRSVQGPQSPGTGGPPLAEAELDVDTALWIADLVTDADGRAEVEFRLPPRSTRWRLRAIGAGTGASFGDVTSELVARAELSAELRAPVALFEGDAPRIAARLFTEGLTGEARLTLLARRGDVQRSLSGTVRLGGDPSYEHLFDALDPALLTGTDNELVLELAVELQRGSETLRARASERVAVLPYGIELGDAASGPLAERVVRELTLPEGAYSTRRVVLRVGASLESVLLDEALARGPALLRGCIVLPRDPAADLIGVATLRGLWRTRAGVDPTALASLEARGDVLIAELVALQMPQGSFRAHGREGPVDVALTARALWAFAVARDADFSVPPQAIERGLGHALGALRDAAQRAPELEAMLVHALALFDRGDFAVTNRLHRMRASLSTAALAHTALALTRMGSRNLAGDMAAVLEERVSEAGEWAASGGVVRAPLEASALAVLALHAAKPGSAVIDAGVDALLARRPWHFAGARGLAVAAVAQHSTRETTGPVPVEVLVTVDEMQRRIVVAPGDPAATEVFELGPGAGGRVRVDLERRGLGEPHFLLVLEGLNSDMQPRPAPAFELLERRLLAPAPIMDGLVLPRGFDVLERFAAPWTNTVANLEFASRTTLRVEWQRRVDAVATEPRAPLVLDLPLPGGARVVPGGVRGGAAHRVQDGRVLFHIDSTDSGGAVEVDLVGLVPGTYRTPSPLLFDAALPRERAIGAAGELTVLARGASSPDEYRPTPDERFHAGLRLFERGDRAAAAELLGALFDQFGMQLRDEPLKQLAWVLFRAGLESGDAAALVRSFELLRERDPERRIVSGHVVRAARAYDAQGEHDRSLRLFRAVIEDGFGVELAAARALAEREDSNAALELMDRLVLEHPDFGVVLEAHLDLAGRMLDTGLARGNLVLRGVLLLERFLAFHPTHALAPEAGLDLVHALTELRDPARAARYSADFAAAYTAPLYRDAFRYAGGLAQWQLGELPAARALFTEVATAVYTDTRGRTFVSPNRQLARYLLAQIAHATGDARTALEHYGEVENDFPDARSALDELRREVLELDEVTSGRPGAPMTLELRHRNASRVELLVYAVDLLTLYLREKDLSQVTEVELAGIAPAQRRTVDLEPGPDLRARTTRVALTLPRPGAYLVIARGAERFTSGLVLSTDLELEVHEDLATGSVRVQTFERAALEADPGFAVGVDVRVVGTEGGAIRSGRTDRRGLFTAHGLLGRATVVARLGDHYAFHRGEVPFPSATARARAAATPEYREHLQQLHRSSRDARSKSLQSGLEAPAGLRLGELQ